MQNGIATHGIATYSIDTIQLHIDSPATQIALATGGFDPRLPFTYNAEIELTDQLTDNPIIVYARRRPHNLRNV